MATPYRGSTVQSDGQPVENDGLVDDLVKQFADPYAFLRELVQNAIDAGTPRIDVRLDAHGDAVRVSVQDHGEGMDPDVIENKLLVLFRSGKEGMEGKIGKFGVGFISVLALSPERVTVTTSKGTGRSWTLHLMADHSYELFETLGGGAAGTTVSLEVRGKKLPDVARRSRAALEQWCRHARVPIWLHVSGEGERIDRPFEVVDGALVTLRAQVGETDVVVAVTSDEVGRAAFFNHGLTLAEMPSPLPGLTVKVLDARLSHTLSRDDVRRDAAFERALRAVRQVAERMHAEVIASFEAAVLGDDAARFGALFARAHGDRGVVPLRDVPLPLLHPLDGQRARPRRALGKEPLCAHRASPLTEALAAAGVPVVDLSIAREARGGADLFRERFELVHASDHATLLQVRDATPAEGAMLDRLRALLEVAARCPKHLALVAVEGKRPARVAFGGPLPSPTALVRESLDGDPFRLLRRPPALLLRAEAPLVQRARAFAPTDPELAAQLLARAILLEHGRLDDGACRALAEASLGAILPGAAS